MAVSECSGSLNDIDPLKDLVMPFFEDFYEAKIRGTSGIKEANSVLDLRTASQTKALEALNQMLQQSQTEPAKTIAIQIARPIPGNQSLFQPVGRALLEAKRQGVIERLETLPSHDGLGFYISLTGHHEQV